MRRENVSAEIKELFKYAICGSISAGLDMGVFVLLSGWMPLLAANALSVHCGIICSFFLNRHFTFKTYDKIWVRFLSFYLVGLSGLALSEFLLYMMVKFTPFSSLMSKLGTVVVVALFQYVLNKFISFKKHGL